MTSATPDWYDRGLAFYRLQEGRYEAVTKSLAFPILTDEILTKFLAQSQTEGQDETLLVFEEWLRPQPA